MSRRFTLTAETVDRVVEPSDVLNTLVSGEVLKHLLGAKWTRPDGGVVTIVSVDVWVEGGRWQASPEIVLELPDGRTD